MSSSSRKKALKATSGRFFSRFVPRVQRLLASEWFFRGVVAWFAISASWIALSSIYPLIFDETYHVGIIDTYASQWSPFIATQPSEARYYGDITRETSYLFHYLMSFPYRLIGVFTDDFVTKILLLRIINISFVVAALVLWRRVLAYFPLGRASRHAVILFFTLIPLASYTAANINYDNLLFLLLPILLLLLFRMPTSRAPLAIFLAIVGLSGVMSVIKFTALPIIVVSSVAALYLLWQRWSREGKVKVWHTFISLKKRYIVLAAAFTIIGFGLFAERYVLNIAQYGAIRPACEELQSRELCADYSVWARNTAAKAEAESIDRSELWSPLEFTYNRWVPHIFNDLFITAMYTDGQLTEHQYMPQNLRSNGGFIVARVAAAVALLGGVIAVLVGWRRINMNYRVYTIAGMFVLYAGALWYTNYSGYVEYGQAYATQGRYMLPFIIPVSAVMVMAATHLVRRKSILMMSYLALVLTMLPAAGALTYIAYSEPSWQWEGIARDSNAAVRSVLRHITF